MKNDAIKTIDNAITRLKTQIKQVENHSLFTKSDQETLIPFYKDRLKVLARKRAKEDVRIKASNPIFIEAKPNPVAAGTYS